MERNQAGVINMKEKIINRLLEITGGLSVIALFIGIYISLEFLGILWVGELLYWIFMILLSPLFLIAAYMFLKDVHQSNLEDIEEYQSEDKTEQNHCMVSSILFQKYLHKTVARLDSIDCLIA